jgi:hypothetical protein
LLVPFSTKWLCRAVLELSAICSRLFSVKKFGWCKKAGRYTSKPLFGKLHQHIDNFESPCELPAAPIDTALTQEKMVCVFGLKILSPVWLKERRADLS